MSNKKQTAVIENSNFSISIDGILTTLRNASKQF